MKAFVFENVDKVSENYHEGGGLFIIAESEEQAKELIEKEKYIEVTDKEWETVLTFDLDEREKQYNKSIIVFPDAGCC